MIWGGKPRKRSNVNVQAGFTLVELTIAMAIFSFMLVVISSGVIQLLRMNAAAAASRNSQQETRLLAETITRQLRTAQTVRVIKVDAHRTTLCLYDGGQYLQYRLDGDRLKRATIASLDVCGQGAGSDEVTYGTTTEAGNEPAGMKVVRFIAILPDSNKETTATLSNGIVGLEISTVGVNVEAGDLNDTHTSCLADANNQYCAVTTVNTSAELRGGGQRDRTGV